MEVPTQLSELIWYLLVGTAGILLYSIKAELRGMRDDLKEERLGREALALEVAAIKARCLAYHDVRQNLVDPEGRGQ